MSTPKGISNADLKVAQDIKNNRDFIYQTNQSLQTLGQGLLSQSTQHEKVLAKSHSDHKELLIAFENFSNDHNTKFNQLNQRLGTLETKLHAVVGNLLTVVKSFDDEYTSKENFSLTISNLTQKVEKLEKDLTIRHDYFAIAIATADQRFNKRIQDVQKELTPIIPEIDPVKKQLDDRFAIFKVDFDGLVREIALLKNAVAYDQKKFENIYTLIERLKEGQKCQQV